MGLSNLQTARLLGWTSLAVGITEVAATDWLEEVMGVGNHKVLIRSFGAREIVAGATILSQPGINAGLAAGLWSRVAGDILDIGMLGEAAAVTRKPLGLATVLGVVLAVTAVDVLVALGVQTELTKGNAASRSARQRVRPSRAIPEKLTEADLAERIPT